MKNHCVESVGFSVRAALWFRRPVLLFTRSFLSSMLQFDPLAIFIVKCNDSVSFSFLFPCFFFFVCFFFIQIASFQLKANHSVFERVRSFGILWDDAVSSDMCIPVDIPLVK